MRLRNKKTREIGRIAKTKTNDEEIEIITDTKVYLYTSILKVCQEWEDYEEPKPNWYINDVGEPEQEGKSYVHEMKPEKMKVIGNYFETKEEAEKAVEKLKAWKRLKDAGAEFYGWRRNQTGTYELYMRWCGRIPRSYEVKKDLDLLFGGE